MYYTSIYSTKYVNWVDTKIHYFAGRHLEYLVTAGDTKSPPARLLMSDRSITRNNSQKPGAFQCIRHLWTEPGLKYAGWYYVSCIGSFTQEYNGLVNNSIVWEVIIISSSFFSYIPFLFIGYSLIIFNVSIWHLLFIVSPQFYLSNDKKTKKSRSIATNGLLASTIDAKSPFVPRILGET